ncbi:MAG: RagB/SusD family nutrient uptake outer membrane protein [Bacteroidota bacterium]
MKNKLIYLSLLVFGLLVSCDNDISNPNAATDGQILSSTDGLIGMVNGMKFRYTIGGASGLYAGISANGLTTNELQILNAGNAELAQLGNGGDNVAPNNAVLTNLWTNLNLILADAEKVLNNAPDVIQDPANRSWVLAYANFFKALALGTMAQYWENVPLTSSVDATFSTRDAALTEAVNLLSEASSLTSTALPSAISSAIGTDIDLPNAIRALSARYNLMAGNLDAANTDANAVDLTSTSVFNFDNVTPNPVFRSSLITQNVYDVNPDFGLSGELAPDANDGRIAFYLTPNANDGKGFFTSDEAAIPVYLPGEMMLIKAEVAARQNRIGDAITELNNVLTKTDDIYGVNAGLTAYSGDQSQAAVLTTIFQNRAIELFMSGLKLEDSRRFNRPGPNDANPERNRNFYPYPNVERDNNPNTPADPVI